MESYPIFRIIFIENNIFFFKIDLEISIISMLYNDVSDFQIPGTKIDNEGHIQKRDR